MGQKANIVHQKDNLVFPEANGSIKKWNTKTDEFVVIDSKGHIVTYYKQSCKNSAEKMLVLILSRDERRDENVCSTFEFNN